MSAGLSVFKDNVTSIINYKVISLFLNITK